MRRLQEETEEIRQQKQLEIDTTQGEARLAKAEAKERALGRQKKEEQAALDEAKDRSEREQVLKATRLKEEHR